MPGYSSTDILGAQVMPRYMGFIYLELKLRKSPRNAYWELKKCTVVGLVDSNRGRLPGTKTTKVIVSRAGNVGPSCETMYMLLRMCFSGGASF